MSTVKTTYVALVIVAMACFNVHAQRENKISENGSSITKETAQDWIANFKTKHANEIYGHTYGKDMLRKLLNVPGAAGIYVFNGLDGDGKVHLVFKAADENGKIIQNGVAYNSGLTCPPYCVPPEDITAMASLGNQIAEGLAQQWIQNFQSNSQERIFGHLYGKDVINEILSAHDIKGVHFVYGLDETGFEHLVLIGLNRQGDFSWESPINRGLTCPSNCAEGYPVVGVAKNK